MPVTLFAQTGVEQHTMKAVDQLNPPSYSSVKIEGRVGKILDSCIQNGVMAVDYGLYSIPFRDKSDEGGMFMGEFWGRKYALLGLVAYYDLTGDTNALNAASSAVDELIEIAGPGKQKLTETGLRVLGSMSSTSVLEPVVQVYQRTGNKKYLDFAIYMVSLWSEPNAYTDKGMRLIEDAMAGVPPVKISSPKAYEVMSCYEGLCELYRATGESRYLDAVVKYGESLIEREIMIVGSGSSAELWCDGAFRQTELLEQPMETCVTATWMKFCYQLLKLTGDPKWADQLEISLYNSMAGAMNHSGNWWAYFSPLKGERMPSPMQVPQCQSSCCVANGPRGLLITPGWSVMSAEDGPVFNLYAPGTWDLQVPDGTTVRFTQKTSYPLEDQIDIQLEQEQPSTFTVSLRIPGWSKQSEISVNGESIPCAAGEYVRINRKWKNSDRISLKMDLRGRIISAPGNVNDKAIMRGPVVLALDSRMVEEADYNLWLYPENIKWTHADDFGGLDYVLPETVSTGTEDVYIELVPSDSIPANVWMAFEVPFLYRYTHFFNHTRQSILMCDYASAGNEYSTDNLFRVWIPQPLYMHHIFPEETWKILYREGDKRPEFPDLITTLGDENTWERSGEE